MYGFHEDCSEFQFQKTYRTRCLIARTTVQHARSDRWWSNVTSFVSEVQEICRSVFFSPIQLLELDQNCKQKHWYLVLKSSLFSAEQFHWLSVSQFRLSPVIFGCLTIYFYPRLWDDSLIFNEFLGLYLFLLFSWKCWRKKTVYVKWDIGLSEYLVLRYWRRDEMLILYRFLCYLRIGG